MKVTADVNLTPKKLWKALMQELFNYEETIEEQASVMVRLQDEQRTVEAMNWDLTLSLKEKDEEIANLKARIKGFEADFDEMLRAGKFQSNITFSPEAPEDLDEDLEDAE